MLLQNSDLDTSVNGQIEVYLMIDSLVLDFLEVAQVCLAQLKYYSNLS